MQLLWFLVIGLVAGWIASMLVRGRGFGCVGSLAVGVVGAFIGGLIVRALNIGVYGFWGALLAATAGAVVLLLIAGLLVGGPRRN